MNALFQPEDPPPLQGVKIAVAKKLGRSHETYNRIVVEMGGDYSWHCGPDVTHFVFQVRGGDRVGGGGGGGGITFGIVDVTLFVFQVSGGDGVGGGGGGITCDIVDFTHFMFQVSGGGGGGGGDITLGIVDVTDFVFQVSG